MELGLSGAHALVSGASRGIGRAIALALAREGCRVAAIARGREDLAAVAAELARAGGGPHLTISTDVTTPEGAHAAIDGAVGAFGSLDCIVANVGKSGARHCDDMDDADFARMLDLNLWSTERVCQYGAAAMKERGGAIVMIASIWGREAGGSPGYNVGKAGVIALAKAMARDYARYGIRVNSIAPGSILFPGGGWDRRQQAEPEKIAAFVQQTLPLGRFGTPEEVANVVAFVCSPRASWISGACIPVDGCQSIAF